jgi:hypothetical protein
MVKSNGGIDNDDLFGSLGKKGSKSPYLDYNNYSIKNSYKINNIYNKKIISKLDDLDTGNKPRRSPSPYSYPSTLSSFFTSYFNSNQQPRSNSSGINWGREEVATSENAYVQPSPEEVQRVLAAVHMMKSLPEDKQRRLIEATREIRFFFDGQIRARFGGTQHFNAIRCLNDPTRTDVATPLSLRDTQLAGEEFFALNRFMVNYPDIADIQWWAVYQNGSWRLDTWNPQGEHLDTGVNGWGDLVGSVMKVNGRVLNPNEMLAFYRTMRLRNEREFVSPDTHDAIKRFLSAVGSQEELSSKFDEQVETAIDLGLVDENGRSLTYAGKSMLGARMSMPVTARQRKARQLTETDDQIRRIIVPTIFN